MLEISEYINLNGVKQYILATGNENGPLMLFLHGGPGVSQSGFIRKYQSKNNGGYKEQIQSPILL